MLAVAILLPLTACGLLARRIPAGERFDILPGERVWVQGPGLVLKLETVGHAWTVDGGEIPFADVTVVRGFRRRCREMAVGEAWHLDGATIHLRAADPFGDNGCTFEVLDGP